MQKGRNHILLIELVPGGKGESVDAAKLAVRPVVYELFDRARRLRLRRLSQSSEEAFGFSGKFHGTVGLVTVTVYPVARKNGKQVTDAPTIPALAMAASSQSFKFKSHGLVRFGA